MDRARRAWAALRRGLAGLSWVTRGYLCFYALIALHHVVFRYAPGQMLLAAGEPEAFTLEGRELFTVIPVAPDGKRLLAGIRPGAGQPGELWLFDASENGFGVPIGKTAATWMPAQALVGDPLRFVTREDDRSVSYAWREDAAPEASALPADFMWLREKGPPVRAEHVAAALAGRDWGHMHAAPAKLAMNLALVRPAVKSWQKPTRTSHWSWVAGDNDLVLFDRETVEPLAYAKTLKILTILHRATTGWPGFLYLSDTGRSLNYVYCGDEGPCGGDRAWVRIDFDHEVVVAAGHRGELARIAVCTDKHLWFYEGSPEAEEGNLLLGKVSLRCDDLFILDARTVIVRVDKYWKRIRFEGELP